MYAVAYPAGSGFLLFVRKYVRSRQKKTPRYKFNSESEPLLCALFWISRCVYMYV